MEPKIYKGWIRWTQEFADGEGVSKKSDKIQSLYSGDAEGNNEDSVLIVGASDAKRFIRLASNCADVEDFEIGEARD